MADQDVSTTSTVREHCMGLVVTLQHDGTRGLRGCMIMQSTTWPWRTGVDGCR